MGVLVSVVAMEKLPISAVKLSVLARRTPLRGPVPERRKMAVRLVRLTFFPESGVSVSS